MDLMKMMGQAKALQEKMGAMQEEIADLEVKGASGGGMVEVTMTGKGEVRALKIDPILIVPEDVEMLEDLIVAAANDAKTKADQALQQKTQEMMGGLGLPPGFKLPF